MFGANKKKEQEQAREDRMFDAFIDVAEHMVSNLRQELMNLTFAVAMSVKANKKKIVSNFDESKLAKFASDLKKEVTSQIETLAKKATRPSVEAQDITKVKKAKKVTKKAK